MANATQIDDRWPVLVGVAAVTQRDRALDPAGLMRAALAGARADAGPALAPPDLVLVPRGMWRHPDPGRAAAIAAGSPSPRSSIAELGVLQHTLFARAFSAVVRGEAMVAAVLGGEARSRSVHGGEEEAGEGEPDEVLRPASEILTRLEVARGLGVPAHQYALIESALAHAAGRSPVEQTEVLAALWAMGAAAAAGQPGAWHTDAPSAADIAGGVGGNRMISTPYRKWLVSDWTVDQAAALLVTSAGAARAAGIPPERWVVPVAAAESNLMVPVSARAELGASPAMVEVGAALRAAGAAVADADLVEIYSCFPSAVQVQAAALGIDPWRGWTVSGGMHFGGGPLNNFVLQATVAVVEALRAGRGRTALVTSVSGMITKVGAMSLSTADASGAAAAALPADADALWIDVSDAARAGTVVREVVDDLGGDLTVAAHTVVHDRAGAPAQAVVLAESADGRRTIATSSDPGVLADLVAHDRVGTPVRVEVGAVTAR